MKNSTKVIILVLLVLVLDQSLKIWVKTTMAYQEEISLIGNWALLHFVENNGMAFGLSLDGDYGKLALSIFRIVAVLFLVYYIKLLTKAKTSFGLLASFALILAGALGNIIDSAFYGMIFSASKYHGGIATFLPPDGGYSSFLHGKVVDMLYFPLIDGYFPDWLPIWGGEHFLFFRPVFNIADMSITIGVLSIILFHRDFFNSNPLDNKPIAEAEDGSPIASADTETKEVIREEAEEPPRPDSATDDEDQASIQKHFEG